MIAPARWGASGRRGLFGAAGLLLSVIALAAAFWGSVDGVARRFHRAALAQEQYAAAIAIEGLVAAGDRRRLAGAMAAYRALVGRETALLDPGERAEQAGELAEIGALARLAGTPAGPARTGAMRAVVARIVGRERGEAARVAAEVEALRRRTLWVAALLAGAAIACALIGGAGLLAANRRLAREVALRTAAIEEVDRSRRLFFAKASHELRTPVTVMRGEAEVVLGDRAAAPSALREALGHVVAQAEFLEHRIAELLGLAQADDGRVRLEVARFDLGAAAAGAVAATAAFARSSEVAVTLAIEAGAGTGPGAGAGAGTALVGDRRWLEQAVVAIIDNAVKFSGQGGVVEVVVGRTGGLATLAVADRGAGLVDTALPRLFDAYYQAEAGRARGGSGLGLALARWVVEQHGGSIAADHRAGGGCRIVLELPVAA